MQKSAYQDATFAAYWDERAGDEGEAYKRYVLDPLLFGLVGSFKDKTILEMGCGNGYLAAKFLECSPKEVILADISEHNLRNARAKCSDKRVRFLQQDATEQWAIPTESVDVVYSNMMLNEVADITVPISEAFRVLRAGGAFVFSVTHPAWDMYVFAQEKAGMPSKKIKHLGGFFRRGPATFIMSGDSKNKPSLKTKYAQEFEVEHYQRPLGDYFNRLVDAGFTVQHLAEPEPTEELLRYNPSFAMYADNPISLVLYSLKP